MTTTSCCANGEPTTDSGKQHTNEKRKGGSNSSSPAVAAGSQGDGTMVPIIRSPPPSSSNNYQKISILVFRGYPYDSVDTRVAKLHLSFLSETNGESSRDRDGSRERDITFEIRRTAAAAASPPHPVVHESTSQGPPSKRPRFLRKIDVATVHLGPGGGGERDANKNNAMALRDTIRAISPNPEWDDRNWVDDVLRVLQTAWPSQIHNSDVTYALNYMVDVLYRGS
ncbi:hypothetical protein SLS62_010905 [Diatrype stigma]|uniref:Uncharacterized protein n=1 Tax=Diatrype stigma TaxID=117547 RepID=A0AAN9YH69_9PEZI